MPFDSVFLHTEVTSAVGQAATSLVLSHQKAQSVSRTDSLRHTETYLSIHTSVNLNEQGRDRVSEDSSEEGFTTKLDHVKTRVQRRGFGELGIVRHMPGWSCPFSPHRYPGRMVNSKPEDLYIQRRLTGDVAKLVFTHGTT